MASSVAPLYVFIIFFIITISTILTDHEAVPHMATNDDEYNGYYIPKGTIVFGNSWSVMTQYEQLLVLICVLTRTVFA